MKQVLKGFLGRGNRTGGLGCGEFGIDPDLEILVEPTKDPGVFRYGARTAASRMSGTHQRAVVILDADWDGSPGAAAIRRARQPSVWRRDGRSSR